MIHLLYTQASIIGKMRYYFLDRHYNLTIRLVLIGLCLGATLVSAILFEGVDTGKTPILGLIPILALAGIAGLAFVYTDLERFGLIVLAVTLLVNDGISTGSGTKATFTFVLLFVWLFIWLFKMIVIEKRVRIRSTPANIPILLFIAIVLVSLVWSSSFPEPSVRYLLESKFAPRMMTALVLIISPLTFLMYANHVRSLGTLRFIAWLFISTGFVFLVFRLGLGYVPRPLNAGGQFPTWVGVIALGQFLFNKDLKSWLRIILLVTIAGWLYVTMRLGVTWLSGWLPLLVGFVVVLFFYSRKLFVLTLLIGLALFLFSFAYLEENFARESEESGGTRSQAWERAFDVTGRHFLFGTGPAGYHFYFTVNVSGFFQLSHNNYVDIIAQTGVAGFVVWIFLWGGIGLMTWRLYRIMPKMGGGFQRGFAISLAASYFCTLTAMMLGDWITPFPYTQTLQGIDYTIWAWMLPGLAAAFYYITLEQNAAQKMITEIETEALPGPTTAIQKTPALSHPAAPQETS